MLPKEPWQTAVRRCLRRVATWKTPPNWSHDDWMEEMCAEAEVSAWSLYREVASCGQEEPPLQCIYQHALNACLQRYRQEWRYTLHCPCSLDVIERSETRCADLYAALDSLPEGDRRLLHQLFWERCTETELARQQGVSVQAVSKRKQAALKKLRKLMR